MHTISKLNFEAEIAQLPLKEALFWGFRSGDRGAHTSRTMMLDELSLLLCAVPDAISREDYAMAAMMENCLGKKTAANRRISLQRLTELYALDDRVVLFRVLRELWVLHNMSRPLLALLLALARDPLLRITASAVIHTPYDYELTRQSMKGALVEVAADRLNEHTLDTVIRNASSSWTQSGHLQGRVRKTRQCVQATPVATAYALLLGYATGRRGALLFQTPWCKVLDADTDELIEKAVAAKRFGLLDLKQSGSMIDVTFPVTLIGRTHRRSHGAY